MHSLLHLHLFIETLVTLFGSDGGMQLARRVIRSKPAVVHTVVDDKVDVEEAMLRGS